MIEGVKFADAFLPLFDQYKYKMFYGGRGGGKSIHFALALLAIGRERKCLILCAREIQNSIKDSVHKLLKTIIEKFGLFDYVVTDKSIINRVTGTEFIFRGLLRNEMSIKSIQGITHCWIEEAQSVSGQSLEYLIKTVIRKDVFGDETKGGEIWASFNPFNDPDPIWKKICLRNNPKMYLLKINIYDLPKELQDPELLEEMEFDRKYDPELAKHTWDGEPIGQSSDAVLKRSDITKAMERNIELDLDAEIMNGADIARFGDDKITFYKFQGDKVTAHESYMKLSTPETEEKLKDFIGRKSKEHLSKIDMGNMGSGIYDHLKLSGYNVSGVDFGATKNMNEPDRYYDKATEMWFNFADSINNVDIPEDHELKEELAGRLYVYKKKNVNGVEHTVKMIEPKKDFKKRIGRSCDKADGLILAYYQPKQSDFFIWST